MKNIKLIFSVVIFVLIASCSVPDGIDKNLSFLGSSPTTNASKIFDISTDNSGNVKITPLADGASSYVVSFGHGVGTSASANVPVGGSTTHTYPEGKYTVSITSVDITGNQTTATYPLDVVYRAPENISVSLGTDGYNTTVKKVTALYAKSFLVYFGDVANEVGTPLAATVNVATGVATSGALPVHVYAPTTVGTYKLKVVALSGGVATTTKITGLVGLPMTYEDTDQDYGFFDFGNAKPTKIANPFMTGLNTSASVMQYTKNIGAEVWSGVGRHVDLPIDFSTGNKLRVLVYTPDATNVGKKVNAELEWVVGGTPGNGVAVSKVATTVSGQWEELVFDYSAIAAIPVTAKFTQLVFRYNDSAKGTGEIIYIDNIRFTN